MKTTIEVLTPKNLKDLTLLFSTSEECKECWCMNHRCTPTACPTGGEAAKKFAEKLCQNEVGGLIAYINSKPILMMTPELKYIKSVFINLYK